MLGADAGRHACAGLRLLCTTHEASCSATGVWLLLFPVVLQSGKILGMQAVGEVEGVEKRVDVVAMAMQVRLAALGGESQGLVKLTAQPWVLAAWRGRGHGGRRGEVSSGCSALKSSNVCMVHRLMSRSEEGHTEERCEQCLPLPSLPPLRCPLLQMGGTVFDLEEAELCYAPQYGSAKDVINFAGMVAANVLRGDMPVRAAAQGGRGHSDSRRVRIG